jgi:hypothetical protein
MCSGRVRTTTATCGWCPALVRSPWQALVVPSRRASCCRLPGKATTAAYPGVCCQATVCQHCLRPVWLRCCCCRGCVTGDGGSYSRGSGRGYSRGSRGGTLCNFSRARGAFKLHSCVHAPLLAAGQPGWQRDWRGMRCLLPVPAGRWQATPSSHPHSMPCMAKHCAGPCTTKLMPSCVHWPCTPHPAPIDELATPHHDLPSCCSPSSLASWTRSASSSTTQ